MAALSLGTMLRRPLYLVGQARARQLARLHHPTARELHARLSPAPSAVARGAIEALERDGFAAVAYDELMGGDGPSWAELTAAGNKFRASPEFGERMSKLGGAASFGWKESYLIRRQIITTDPVDTADPLLQVGISNPVLSVVHGYLGMLSKLTLVDWWYTLPDPDLARSRKFSQRWHRDREDRRIVKIFLLLKDVTEGAGPTEYIPGSREGGRFAAVAPLVRGTCPPDRVYPPEERVDRLVPPEERVKFIGPAGTIFFVDTAGLHRGGFATTDDRFFAYYTYVSPASLASRRVFRLTSDPHEPPFDELRRYVLSDAATRNWGEYF